MRNRELVRRHRRGTWQEKKDVLATLLAQRDVEALTAVAQQAPKLDWPFTALRAARFLGDERGQRAYDAVSFSLPKWLCRRALWFQLQDEVEVVLDDARWLDLIIDDAETNKQVAGPARALLALL